MARIVLQEKLQAEEKSEQYRELYEQAKQSILDLDEELQQLKADYKEVADKRSYYLARMESARLQQRLHARSSVSQDASPRMFGRLKSAYPIWSFMQERSEMYDVWAAKVTTVREIRL